MARLARKSERGLTLLETVIALAIVFIVFLGLTDASLLVVDYNIKNTVRDEGVSVAETEMAAVREIPFSAIPVGVTNRPAVTRQIRGLAMAYTPTWTITALNADNLQVVVNVGWTRRGKPYNHQATTLVRKR
jgi:type II secretory pathway pseudopilin PulG